MNDGLKKIMPFQTPESLEALCVGVDKAKEKLTRLTTNMPCCKCKKPTKSHIKNNEPYCHPCWLESESEDKEKEIAPKLRFFECRDCGVLQPMDKWPVVSEDPDDALYREFYCPGCHSQAIFELKREELEHQRTGVRIRGKMSPFLSDEAYDCKDRAREIKRKLEIMDQYEKSERENKK